LRAASFTCRPASRLDVLGSPSGVLVKLLTIQGRGSSELRRALKDTSRY
jgi:hypothetical protein